MTATEPSFDHFLSDLRGRDEAAAQRLFAEFAPRLIAVARRRLDRRLRSKVDPDDVALSVMRTVCLRLQQGQFRLEGWDSLWGLMVRVALRKCARWAEHFGAHQRDVSREQGMPAGESGERAWEPAAAAQDPAEALYLEETLAEALRGLTPDQEKILELRLEGLGQTEIAARLDCSQAKVSRALRVVEDRLEHLARPNENGRPA
jgi:RNA polymerase sigma factor (sigma-70 family)